jgi:hypothetical protein
VLEVSYLSMYLHSFIAGNEFHPYLGTYVVSYLGMEFCT